MDVIEDLAIDRAKKLGVAFDIQPFWLYLDGPAIKDVFGPDRMKHFQPLRDLIDAGIVVGGGSDHMIRFDLAKPLIPITHSSACGSPSRAK